jgi:cation diffusion facilitator CzcD-associated flavoprotein CzcO
VTVLDVAVVGAGPYGLAVGAHLDAAGLSFRVFGEPMESWLAHMPRGMFLKSEGFASNIADPEDRLTLRRFCAETGRAYGDYGEPVSLETFAEYGLWFCRQAVPALERVRVERIGRRADAFALELTSGETAFARRVVVAAGVGAFAYVPSELDALRPAHVTHAFDHDDLEPLRGKQVAVVGAGQSALETAALLHEHGASPLLLARRHVLCWNEFPERGRRPLRRRIAEPIAGLGAGWKAWGYSNLPLAFTRLPATTRRRHAREAFGPAGAWWLRERFEGCVPVLLACTVRAAAADADGVRLRVAVDGVGEEVLVVDHVIAGTGYRPAVDRLPFLQPLRADLRVAHGSPVLSRRFESSVPGLYFTGLASASTFGPAMRFVFGTRFAARRIGADLARSLRARRRRPRLTAAAETP